MRRYASILISELSKNTYISFKARAQAVPDVQCMACDGA